MRILRRMVAMDKDRIVGITTPDNVQINLYDFQPITWKMFLRLNRKRLEGENRFNPVYLKKVERIAKALGYDLRNEEEHFVLCRENFDFPALLCLLGDGKINTVLMVAPILSSKDFDEDSERCQTCEHFEECKSELGSETRQRE